MKWRIYTSSNSGAKAERIDVNGNHEPLADRVYEGTVGSYTDGAAGGGAGQAIGRGSKARPAEAVPQKAQPAGGDVDGRSPEREARTPGDERAGVEPAKPSEKFLVYRIGAKPLLENRNAGNADAIARHAAYLWLARTTGCSLITLDNTLAPRLRICSVNHYSVNRLTAVTRNAKDFEVSALTFSI